MDVGDGICRQSKVPSKATIAIDRLCQCEGLVELVICNCHRCGTPLVTPDISLQLIAVLAAHADQPDKSTTFAHNRCKAVNHAQVTALHLIAQISYAVLLGDLANKVTTLRDNSQRTLAIIV